MNSYGASGSEENSISVADWLKVVASLGLFAVMAVGMFVAGHVGLFEILIEFGLVLFGVWSVGHNAQADDEDSSDHEEPSNRSFIGRLYSIVVGFKEKKVEEVLSGNVIWPATQLILLGVLFGWILTLAWLLVRDWHFVLAREIQETALDVVVMGPLLVLVAITLRASYLQIKSDDYDYDDDYDDDLDVANPMSPDFNPIAAYGGAGVLRGIGAAWMERLAMFFTSGFLLFVGGVSYIAGSVVGNRWPIGILEQIASWHL